MKKGQQWIERILQWGIILTGAYIIYRGTGILAETGWLKQMIQSEKTAEVMQEITLQTYLPGYLAALEQLPEENPVNKWMEWFVPVLKEWYELTKNEAEVQVTEKETEAQITKEEAETQIMEGETEAQTTEKETETHAAELGAETEDSQETLGLPMEELGSFEYLVNHYYVVDSDTMVDETQLDAAAFLKKDLSIEKNPQVPQILIYHTHSQEAFVDSVEGDVSTGIVGMGEYLKELLEETYGYQVIHDTGVYDLVDGVLDRSAAYDYARKGVEKLLEEYPTIEVLIDLHRDGVDGQHFVTEIDGKKTARIMFFNGLSRNSAGQEITYLHNPYLEENLAFSFQMQWAAQQQYPGFTRNIYLKGQRFNLHLRPRSLLIEAGTQLNTVEEERNAMEPLAKLLDQVLSGS